MRNRFRVGDKVRTTVNATGWANRLPKGTIVVVIKVLSKELTGMKTVKVSIPGTNVEGLCYSKELELVCEHADETVEDKKCGFVLGQRVIVQGFDIDYSCLDTKYDGVIGLVTHVYYLGATIRLPTGEPIRFFLARHLRPHPETESVEKPDSLKKLVKDFRAVTEVENRTEKQLLRNISDVTSGVTSWQENQAGASKAIVEAIACLTQLYNLYQT